MNKPLELQSDILLHLTCRAYDIVVYLFRAVVTNFAILINNFTN